MNQSVRMSVKGILWAGVILLCVLPLSPCFDTVRELPFSTCGTAWAEGGVSVRALVEKDAVSVGEPFRLQIRVEGGDTAPGTAQPDTSGIADFTVDYLGGQSNNSASITIINGKMSRVASYGYVYSYRLTPKKVGTFQIPSITVPLDAGNSKGLRTEPVTIRVSEPEASEDFHLELKYSKTSFYVGEPVILTVIWYVGRDVEHVTFNLPILQNEAFTFADPKADQDPGRQVFQIQTEGGTILAEKGNGVYNGREYTTLSLRKVLFAKAPGSFETPAATVACKALVGYARSQQRRSPFDGFFDDDFFNPGKKGGGKTFVARSHPVLLTARALPEEGRPAGFSGWIGRFHVEASAGPTEVNIGDPITLQVSVSGPEYLDRVELPPLSEHSELEKDFKIPEEMAAGVVQGDIKRFTQTLRPRSAEVQAIPPMRFPYFNPDTGRYEVAQSNPIALTVKPTRVLTSADVEGTPGKTAVAKSALENWSQGIAHNYEGPGVLEREVYRVSHIVRSPLWLAAALAPFLGFACLLVFAKVRQRRMAEPQRLRSRKALGRFEQRVHAIGAGPRTRDACAALLDALRGYLGDRLGANGSALIFTEIEGMLEAHEVDLKLAKRLNDLVHACEQGSYGGLELRGPFDELAKEAIDVARSLDRRV